MINQSTIKAVNKGEYISILRSNGQPMKKIWLNNGYCRTNRAYELVNVEDINDFKYLKKDKIVIIVTY